MSYKHDNKGVCNTFQCLGYRNGLHQESQSISEKKLTTAVISSLKQVLDGTPAYYEMIRSQEPQIEATLTVYKAELEKLEMRENRAKEAYINGVDSLAEYKENKMSLLRRRNEIEDYISKHEKIIKLDPKILQSHVRNVIDVIESGVSFDRKAEALRGCVKYITFYKQEQRLEVHYYLSV